MLGSMYKKRFWVQYMVRDRFYNGGVVLQYLLTISVFFRRSTLLTHFLNAFKYLFFVTKCNGIHMHPEKGKSHSLALIHFQGSKCRGGGAGLHVNIQGATSFAKPAYVGCAAWPLVTQPVALFDRRSFAGVCRSRRSKVTGVDLAGFF